MTEATMAPAPSAAIQMAGEPIAVVEVQHPADFLLADMQTNVYLLFRSYSFGDASPVFCHDAGKTGVKQVMGFNPMHATKDGERGIVTKNLQTILDSIQDISTSCIRVASSEDLDKCYGAMSKSIESQFRLSSWFRGISAFDPVTEKQIQNVPVEYAPEVFSILNKVTHGDAESNRVTYANNVIVTLNVDWRASGAMSLLAYAGDALLKIRKRVAADSRYKVHVGVTSILASEARILTGLSASENQNLENDDVITYYVSNNGQFAEETFFYANAYNKVGPVAEQRKTRDTVMGKSFYLYASV